ncbi:g11580 [Coccomyxa elongata]
MAVNGGADVLQYYCVVLSDKSTGTDGVDKAKGAVIRRLMRSVRCQRIVLQCSEPDDRFCLEELLRRAGLLEEVLRNAGLTSAIFGEPVSNGPSRHDVTVLTGENIDSNAERCKLIINMDVPEESSYMRFLTEADPALPTHAIVTFVTPQELVTLKSFTQPNPEWKIKPLPEVLLGMRHDLEEHQQRSCVQPSCMPEGLAAGSMHTGQTSEESAQGQEKPQSTVEELQIRKQRLLQTLDVLGSQQTGSSQPAAIPATSQLGQNGHGHVNQEDRFEDEVPPPPLGSPRAPQATAAANADTVPKAKLREAARGAACAGLEKVPSQAAALELDRPPSAYPAALKAAEGGERRARQRSAQDAAARKEEQQELALERAILEIHWRQAAEAGGEDDFVDGEAGNVAEDEELEEGELTVQEPATAEDQSMAAAPAWHQHLPPFYQQWGRSAGADNSGAAADAQAADAGAAAHAEPSSQTAAWDAWYRQQGYGAQAADAGAGTGAGAGFRASAWDEWYRQQGYGAQDAPAQHGPGVSVDRTGAGGWEQWHSWQQQGSGAGSAADWGSWPAGSQPRGAPSWAAQGMQGPGKEGFMLVPVALVQRYQMLEWAEWCRQYERWQAAYEQWYTWWTSMMWHSRAHYSASTDHHAGVC